jgi:hypothetical protein
VSGVRAEGCRQRGAPHHVTRADRRQAAHRHPDRRRRGDERPDEPSALIVSGKDSLGGFAQVLTVAQSIEAEVARRERESPQRRAEDAMLAAASWPPPGLFNRETSLSLIRRGAELKARRELAEGDPARARKQAAWDKNNAYTSGLARTMAQLASAPPCGHGCAPGMCRY